MAKYKVIRNDRAANSDVKAGDHVYDQCGYDYGLSSEDTFATGIEHITVTFKDDGDYPGFTIPLVDLEEIK